MEKLVNEHQEIKEKVRLGQLDIALSERNLLCSTDTKKES